jgi:hypothetical protein
LDWTNPEDNLSEVLVRKRLDRFPQNHTDGTEVVRLTSPTEGSPESYTDSGLQPNEQYYYGIFVKAPSGFWNDATPLNADTIS